MLRPLLCVLLFLSALADEFQAPLDALSTLEHRGILECTDQSPESTCDAEEISFMQRHAHLHAAHKIRKSIDNLRFENAVVLRDLGTPGGAQKETYAPVLQKRLVVVGLLGIMLITVAALACYMLDPREEDGAQDEAKGDSSQYEVEVRRHEDLPNDTLGFMILAIVRDSSDIMLGRTHVFSSLSRIVVAASILLLNIGLQVYLFSCILVYVVPAAVSDIRQTYEIFETVMYANQTTWSANHEIRGLDGYFNPDLLSNLDDDVKAKVCAIPLGQPHFFYPLLFIWTMRCIAELKNTTDLTYLLIVRMPTVHSMSESLSVRKVNYHGLEGKAHSLNVKTVVGMTGVIKAILFICVLLPRMCVTCFLCWLGSRWLACASDFGNLVLDAVAVEFLLVLKQLLFITLVSDRNKRDMDFTQIRPETHTERNTWWIYICTSMWFFLGAGWVMFYVGYFQMVIIDYRWDISDVCTSWLSAVYPSSLI
mmetsp:Transcript_140617/g.255645  ORF Transcript_140617/g.255645 Transcript_140617/m.255645 type:complete len:480 (-) Transcript_140617:73-1512(-)